MKIYVVLAILVSVIWSGTVQRSYAAETITVGISTGYPPYYYEKDGELKGICIELLDAVAATLDLEITYKAFPWKRMLANARQGNVDAVMPLFKTKERSSYLYFEDLDIAGEANYFFTLKSKKIDFSGNYTSLHTYTIGVVDGYSYGAEFDSYSGLKKVATLNEEHLLEMLKHGRFDIAVGNKSVILYYAEKKGLADTISFLTPHLSGELLYIGFSKNTTNNEIHLKFARALKTFKKTKKYQQILKKYAF